ncbi:MAG TPA: ABC transporter ATP-binding protein [Desulfobacterales bacterium]
MIRLDNITKHYGNFTAVYDLQLQVAPGEVFGFIGPNGAGKTTTIKIIGGILKPSAGTVQICGIDMDRQPEAAKRKMGFIPDRPYLYEKLTGMEFLQFTADLYGVRRNGWRQKALQELERFSLNEWAEELIESYSHGMRQRLIFAAALLHQPEVLIVDEPMVGLDPVTIRRVKTLFRELARQSVAVFMSTHTLAVAEAVCDRIGVIHRGRLVAVGSKEDLQRDAGVSDSDLEQVFLRLTREEHS